MFWDILKALFFALFAYLAYRTAVLYKRQRQLEAQGVVFNPYFPIVTDMIRIIYFTLYYPQENFLIKLYDGLYGDKQPAMTAIYVFGV